MAERDENLYAVIAIGSSFRSYYREVEFSDIDSILEGIALCTKRGISFVIMKLKSQRILWKNTLLI